MASAGSMSCSPISEGLATLSASPQLEEDTQSPLPAFPLRRRSTVTSHYRPHSTLYTQDEDTIQEHPEPGPSRRNSILGTVFRHSSTRRPSSSGGEHTASSGGTTMGLGMMKKSFSECTSTAFARKGKAKEKPKELPKFHIRKLSDNAVSVSQQLPPPRLVDSAAPARAASSTSTTKMSRPRTSVGAAVEAGAERALHRLKTQRSVASFFSAASSHNHHVSPSPKTVLFEQTPPCHISKVAATSHAAPSLSSASTRFSHRMDVDHHHHHPTSPIRQTKRALLQAEEQSFVKSEMMRDREFIYSDNNFTTRSRTKMHPYGPEATSLFSYDITSFDNDRYTDLLLRRLNPSSPTFLDFGKKQPTTILDIGCGRGYWCVWASSYWKNAQVTGLDLMKIALPAFAATENLTFVQSNFLWRLPFPNKSFDYVRMCNLSYNIPYTQWNKVLLEVKRVLANGGRLEIIDDQLYFPYGEEPKPKEPTARPATPTAANPGSTSSFSSFDDDDEDEAHHDSDSTTDGEDTLEEEVASTSTTSTLVSESDLNASFDKFKTSPCGSKRSSGQSNPGVPRILEVEGREGSAEMASPPAPAPELAGSTPAQGEEEVASPAIDTGAKKEEEIPPSIPVTDIDPPLGPAISPSPTITQASVFSLEEEGSLPSSTTFTPHSPITPTPLPNTPSPTRSPKRQHRKNTSVSSTSSAPANVEAISHWKQHKDLSVNMEYIFEALLLKHAVHPRPAEIIEVELRKVFGTRTGKKVASFHVKLAPYDSPIGPGGAMAPQAQVEEEEETPRPTPTVPPVAERLGGKLEKDVVRVMSSDNLRKHWKQISDKDRRKEKKEEKKLAAMIQERSTNSSPIPKKDVKITAKAAARLGIEPNVPPPSDPLSELSTSSDESSHENVSSRVRATSAATALGALSHKAATRLGVASAVPMGASRSHDPSRPTPSRTLTDPSVRSVSPNPFSRLGLASRPTSPLASPTRTTFPLSSSPTSSSGHLSPPRPVGPPPPPPPRAASRLAVAPLRPISRSVSGSTVSHTSSATIVAPSNSSDPHLASDTSSITQVDGPFDESDEDDESADELDATGSSNGHTAPSAKIAALMGVPYTVLANTSATYSRSAGAMAPVQSPGILVWPNTYIAMSPTELEMHACKHVQALLGARHAMREFITAEFNGQKLASEEDFEEALWVYECFRRSRLHWPNNPVELFKDQSFPDPPPLTAPSPIRRTTAPPPTVASTKVHSRSTSLDSFNGQYRLDDMTHLRTIRVFEAVKDEKSVFSLLTTNVSGR